MPDDSITRSSFLLDPRALEAVLVQELDFLNPDAVAVVAWPPAEARSFAVVMGVAASVFTWIEPRALCELASEVAADWADLTVNVWLLDESAFERAELCGLLERDALAWSARWVQSRFETRAVVETWSQTARELASLVGELLQLPGVEPGEQLFGRGLDSVGAVRLVAHVRERFGVSLELREVLEAPRIAELAARIEALQVAPPVAAVERVSRARAWPLSAAQLRIWLLSRLTVAGPAQHVAGGLALHGALDVEALSVAVERLAQRHESLRTVIEDHTGVPLQRVLPALPVEFRVLSEPRWDAAECVRAAAAPTIDLARGPLWRVWLFERGPREHVLVLCMHHVISDGWSMELAARELLQLYAAETALPELPVQWLDYVAWEAAQLADDARTAQQIAYWREHLTGEQTPLELPRGLARKQRLARSGVAGRTVAFELDRELTARLRALSGSSLFVLLLAAFQLWLARMTGRELIRVGVPVFGRQLGAADALIGCFVNTVVLQLRVAPRAEPAELLQSVDRALRDALAHADVPFDTLVRELSPERSAEHTPFFQVTYNHLRVPALQAPRGLEAERLPREPVGSPFELSLETEELADGRVRAVFNYPVESFAYETVCEYA